MNQTTSTIIKKSQKETAPAMEKRKKTQTKNRKPALVVSEMENPATTMTKTEAAKEIVTRIKTPKNPHQTTIQTKSPMRAEPTVKTNLKSQMLRIMPIQKILKNHSLKKANKTIQQTPLRMNLTIKMKTRKIQTAENHKITTIQMPLKLVILKLIKTASTFQTSSRKS